MFESLKFWKDSPPKTQIRIIEREPFRLTVADWRQDEGLVGVASSVLKSPSLIQMMQVLRNSHPALEVMDVNASPNDRMVQQARCEGYTQALKDFESLGISLMSGGLPEPDFAEEELPTERVNLWKTHK